MKEKIKNADFHVDLFNPQLSEILNNPELGHAIKRSKQFPKEGLKKLDLIFASVYRRINDETKKEAVNSNEAVQNNIRNDLNKIIEYAKSTKNLKIIEKPEDLYIKRKEDENSIILHLEGGDIITNPDIINDLYKRGVRSIGPLYSHDNQLGGGASSGNVNRGLTALGKRVIDRIIEKGMIIDTAHANQKTAMDILERIRDYDKIAATHTAFGEKQRFITEELFKKIAEKGGVVGFTPAKPFFPTLENYLDNFKKASDLAGSTDNLAIGTDFGGLDAEHLFDELDDIGKLTIIAEKLSEKGNYSDEEISKIMYGNIERLVKQI